jgi:hypothetical protein
MRAIGHEAIRSLHGQGQPTVSRPSTNAGHLQGPRRELPYLSAKLRRMAPFGSHQDDDAGSRTLPTDATDPKRGAHSRAGGTSLGEETPKKGNEANRQVDRVAGWMIGY